MSVLEAPTTVLPDRTQRRRRSVLLWTTVLALCGGLFGLAVASTLPASYVAEATVVVAPLRGNAYGGGGGKLLTDLETESQLVSSDAVLRRVAADGGPTPSASEVRARLSVDVVPSAAVLTITYRGDDPGEARDMVQRLTAATLAERVERSKAAGAQQAEVIQRMIAEADKDIDRIRSAAEAAGQDPTARLKLAIQRQVSLNALLAQAVGDPGYPGRLITVVSHGDGGVRRLKIMIVVGSVLVAAAVGTWVGRAARDRAR